MDSHSSLMPPQAARSPLPPPEGGRPVPWSAGKYFAVLALVLVPAALALGVGGVAGELQTAAIIAAVPLAALILWRPIFGILLIAMLVHFEFYGKLGPTFTLTKVLGLYTALAVAIHLFHRPIRLNVWAFWFLVGWLLWSLISIIGSRYPDAAWFSVVRRLQMVGLVFVVLHVAYRREEMEAYLMALFIGSVLGAVGGFFLAPEAEGATGLERATIGEVGANHLAKAAFSGLLLAPWLISRSGRLLKIAAALAVPVMLVALVLTGSRSGYIAFFVGVLALVLAYRGMPVYRRIILAGGVTAALVAFVLIGMVTGLWAAGLYDRIEQLFEEGLRTGNRLWYWMEGLRMGSEHPLIGVGAGNSPYHMAIFTTAMHNDLVTHFSELGVPGLLLYVGFLLGVLRLVSRTANHWLRAGLIGLFVSAVVASLANPSVYVKTFWMQMAACMLGGLITSASRKTAGNAPALIGTQGAPEGFGGA